MYKVSFINGLELEVESCKLKVLSDDDVAALRRDANDDSDDVSSVSHDDGQNVNGTCDDEEEEEREDSELNENSQNSIETMDNTVEDSNNNGGEETPSITYMDKLLAAREKIKNITGDTVESRHNNISIIWRVIENHICESKERSEGAVGLKPEVLHEVMEDETMVACEIFMRLMFGGNMVENVVRINRAIQDYNGKNDRNISFFTNAEFLRGMATFIGAVCFSANGSELWKKDNDDGWVSIEPSADFSQYMPKYRFKEFRQFLPIINEAKTKENFDPWWRYVGGVENFNLTRLKYIVSSNHISMDELMSAWRPRKTKLGGLPNITHIARKPEPLGTEKKCTACSSCKVMLHMEIQRGKDEMKKEKYNRELGATAACTVRLSEHR